MISGGSSSGSALAVATGEVPFTVATDTAGSGRVPPALNGIAGFKPSRGLISTVGLVPACRSLDCISLIAANVPDLAAVFDVVAGVDERDPYTRARRRDTSDRQGLPHRPAGRRPNWSSSVTSRCGPLTWRPGRGSSRTSTAP